MAVSYISNFVLQLMSVGKNPQLFYELLVMTHKARLVNVNDHKPAIRSSNNTNPIDARYPIRPIPETNAKGIPIHTAEHGTHCRNVMALLSFANTPKTPSYSATSVVTPYNATDIMIISINSFISTKPI